MNKKSIAVLIIIAIAILLLIFGGNENKQQDQMLPTRDVEGLEGYASIQEFCTELTASQEFDDSARSTSFYETCLLENQ